MYLLRKIHKILFDVARRPVIWNCSTPSEKVSGFLNHHPKSVIQEGQSYVKDTGNFVH